MSGIFSWVFQYIIAYKYLAIFTVFFVSSFVLPLPLNEINLAMNAYVTANPGFMSHSGIFFTTLAGYLSADSAGYFLAYLLGNLIFEKLSIKKDEKFYKTEDWLKRYAPGTIFLGKIVGPFGPMINFVSGLIGIPYGKFLTYDFLGNFTNVVIFTSAGILLGDNWQVFVQNSWPLAFFVIALFILYIYYRSKKKLKQ